MTKTEIEALVAEIAGIAGTAATVFNPALAATVTLANQVIGLGTRAINIATAHNVSAAELQAELDALIPLVEKHADQTIGNLGDDAAQAAFDKSGE